MSNKNKIMNNAVYSPCDVCTAKPNPLWQLKARKIKHDAESQNVYYKDAVLEIKGFPVFYTPFLSHPDPNVSRRSTACGFTARRPANAPSSRSMSRGCIPTIWG